jgi:hypothetical protein
MSKLKPKAEDKPPPPLTIKSLDELRGIVEKTVTVEVIFDGRPLAIEVRRLTPREDMIIQEILDVVVCPVIQGKTPEQDRPDYASLDYIRKKNQAEVEARALAIYWCVPILQQGRPGLTDRREITDYVQSLLNAQMLTVLFAAVRHGGVTLGELVNFTSTNPSPGS